VAAVLRPCEIRAFVELVKLNQGNMDDVLLIGMDCLGAFSNADYPGFAGDDPAGATRRFLDQAVGGGELNLAKACLACEHPAPEGADLVVGVAGVDLDDFLPVHSRTARGEGLLNRLGLPATTEHQARKQALETLTARRIEFRDRMFEETTQAIGGLDKLAEYLAGCVNCYNCRVACPVCYCRECVFLTDIFDHKPHQYLGWARQKGALKMPTDTVFFHLTRLAHMSTACVGCGQCSNACPNHVPVMELFRTLSDHTQRAFDYQAGRSADEPPPLSVFKEEEFPETISHLA
jgi:formate dehydrogenase subunit beta